jgi:lipopolysaccharide/colanic/teichoic acid biosynthesis glycosyltransferase
MKQPDFTNLIERLAEPELFDPSQMPVGRPYLHSSAKVMIDALLSLGVLPFTSIPTAIGAAAVRIVDHEKPVFRQTRLGYMANPFVINKLRTMPGVPETTHSNGRHSDPRRSQLGRLLSLLRIDESPQLVNVAKREMSIIGPRPLVPLIFDDARHVVGSKEADEWIKVRSLALPGIFDEFSNAHHSYHVEGDEADQLRFRIASESAYILEKASVQEDLRIMGNTLGLFGSTVMRHAVEIVGRTPSTGA